MTVFKELVSFFRRYKKSQNQNRKLMALVKILYFEPNRTKKWLTKLVPLVVLLVPKDMRNTTKNNETKLKKLVVKSIYY